MIAPWPTNFPTASTAIPLARWFVTEAYRITDTAQLITAAGEQLVAAASRSIAWPIFQLTLHPEFMGKGLCLAARPRRRGHRRPARIAAGALTISTIRCRPCSSVTRPSACTWPNVEPQAPVLKQLKAEGATDYVALPLLFYDRPCRCAERGVGQARRLFGDRPRPHVPAAVLPSRRIVETHSLRDTAVNLLDAYVGRAAGQRILAGRGQRGDGQTIEAVAVVLRPARLHAGRPTACRATPSSPCSTTISASWATLSPGAGGENPEIHGRRHAGDAAHRLGRSAAGRAATRGSKPRWRRSA